MPILPIPKVVPDTDILADQFNQAIDGIQDKGGGHDHNGADNHGKPVTRWLIDAGTHDHAGTGLSNTLDWHMDATQGSADHALHGLTPDYRVAGAHAQQLVFVHLRHQFVHAERVGHSCSAGGNGSQAHVVLLGWPYVFSAADVGLATILGFVGGVEGPAGGDWPMPVRIYRAATGPTWGAPHTNYGGWNDGIGGNGNLLTPPVAAGNSYTLFVPSGGLGVMVYQYEEHIGSWDWWFNSGSEADSPAINILAWGLLT